MLAVLIFIGPAQRLPFKKSEVCLEWGCFNGSYSILFPQAPSNNDGYEEIFALLSILGKHLSSSVPESDLESYMMFSCAIFMVCSIMMTSSLAFHMPAAVSVHRGSTTRSSNAQIEFTRSSALQMATWSNGQAIQEYKDFLATGNLYL